MADFPASGLRVRAAGGNANNGTNAGASYTNTNNAATNTNTNYSSPLYFADRKNTAIWKEPCLSAKDKSQKGY